jgi:hypothetical protein
MCHARQISQQERITTTCDVYICTEDFSTGTHTVGYQNNSKRNKNSSSVLQTIFYSNKLRDSMV